MPWEPLPGVEQREPQRVAAPLDRLMDRLAGTSVSAIEVIMDRWPEIVGEAVAGAADSDEDLVDRARAMMTEPYSRYAVKVVCNMFRCSFLLTCYRDLFFVNYSKKYIVEALGNLMFVFFLNQISGFCFQ